MRGIVRYGAYLPHHRLRRDAIAATLGTPAGRGTRSVASYDEDSTTLAVEAARVALRGDAPVPAVLLLATATPAYLDKTNAAAAHAALALPSATVALDSGGALRSGIGSLLLALTGGLTTLVATADIRTGRPGSDEEWAGGDAGAAFLVADGDDVVAEYLGGASATTEFMDRWRLPGEQSARAWEERFGDAAYAPLVDEAVAAGLKDAGLTLEQVDRIVVTGTHRRAVGRAGRALGAAVVDDLSGVVGNSGTAHAGLLLAATLDTAEPGQTIAVVSLADGVDVLVFRVTAAIEQHRAAVGVAEQIAAGRDDLAYATFLTWRGFLDRQEPRRPRPVRPAAPPSYRNRDWKFSFTGSRDDSSATVHLPPARVAFSGHAVDEMSPVRLAETRGTVATYTVDRLTYSVNPPVVVAIVDFDGGGRIAVEMTDVDAGAVAIGDPVEMTFRRLYTADGIHNYFWKARPARDNGGS